MAVLAVAVDEWEEGVALRRGRVRFAFEPQIRKPAIDYPFEFVLERPLALELDGVDGVDYIRAGGAVRGGV